ncbi:hypothetical protein BH10PSE19_BH10PSE19_14290 [soil metagenome]
MRTIGLLRCARTDERISSSKQLSEFPVWTDPSIALARIEWGLYGRPIFNNEGYLQVSLNGSFLQHPGITALYSIDCYHAMLMDDKKSTHKENFLREAQWLNRFIVDSKAFRVAEIDIHSDLIKNGTVEIPIRAISYRLLSLSVLLRAKQFDLNYNYETAIELIVSLLDKPGSENGLLIQHTKIDYIVDGFAELNPNYLSSLLLSVFVIYEYCLLFENIKIKNLLQQQIQSIKTYVDSRHLQEFISFAYIGCDFKMDDYFFIINSFAALAEIANDKFFAEYSRKLAKEFYKYRIKEFIKCKLPI